MEKKLVQFPSGAEREWDWIERKVRERARPCGLTERRIEEVLDWAKNIFQLIPLSISFNLPADLPNAYRTEIESSLRDSLSAFVKQVSEQKQRMLFTMIGMKFGEPF